jgi:hypothetical protein
MPDRTNGAPDPAMIEISGSPGCEYLPDAIAIARVGD